MRGWMIVPGFDGIGKSFTPGRCFMCGTSAQDRQVLCSGVDITNKVETNRYGKVQLCEECIKAAGALLGLIPSDVYERLDVRASEHKAASKRLDLISAKLDAALKAMA